MLSMVEKGIYRYATANNRYMQDHDKNKELSYLKYWDLNNLYGQTMSQKLPVNVCKCVEDTSEFVEDFIKRCNETSKEG